MAAGAENEKAMLLRQVLTPDRICFLQATTKDSALGDMINLLAASTSVSDRDALTDAVFKREAIMSTGIGMGLAVPHVRMDSVRELVMAVGISRAGIDDYVSLDDKPVHLVFLIAAPSGAHVEYLRLLSAISARAKALDGCLLDCPDADAFYKLLVAASDDNPVD